MKNYVDAVVFDLDGVVTLTASVHAAAWKQLFDEYLKGRAEEIEELFVPFDIKVDYHTYVDGKPRIEGVKSFLASRGSEMPEGSPDDGPDEPTAWGLGNRKNGYFQRVLKKQGAEIDERTITFIHYLRAEGIHVAVASSSKNCRPILDRAGLTDLFEARVDGLVSEEIGLKGKPNPDIFIEAAQRVGASPERTVVVEDAISGVQAGMAGGFGLVIGIDRIGAAVALREHGADWIIDGFDDRSPSVVNTWFANRADRRPSALRKWGGLSERLGGKRPALFLDYDGTLTPIVSRPELALLSDERRSVLERIAACCPTAIISGRGRDDVERLVSLPGLAYAGSHGFDIVGPNGRAIDYEISDWIQPVMAKVASELEHAVGGIDGCIVEAKGFSVAVHYRMVNEADVPRIEHAVDGLIIRDDRLKKAIGKKVFEIRPNLHWDKGEALLVLLRALELDSENIVPIYIGDDVTDEDAFRVLQDRGIGILVSEAPRPSLASHWVQAPWEVFAFLNRIYEYAEGGRE